MLIEKTYMQDDPEWAVSEAVHDNDTHLEMLESAYHTDAPVVINATEEHNLLNFIYYLYLYSISGYMQDRRFSDDEYRQDYANVVECLKRNAIDIETLSVLKDTVSKLAAAEKAVCPNGDSDIRRVRKHVHDAIRYEDRPGHIPGVLTGCSVEDAVGQYYDLAVEALAKCANILNNKMRNFASIHSWDEKGEYQLECSSPAVQYDDVALSALNDEEMVDLMARCRELFESGKISWQEPAHSSTPDISTLFQN